MKRPMLDLVYEYANRGCRWQAHVRLAPYEHPEACPVALQLWDFEVKALPGFDPQCDRLIVARELDRAAGDAMLATLTVTTVPVVPQAEMLGGFDGERHELRVVRGDCATILRWWLEVPAGWENAARLADELRARIEGWREELLASAPPTDER